MKGKQYETGWNYHQHFQAAKVSGMRNYPCQYFLNIKSSVSFVGMGQIDSSSEKMKNKFLGEFLVEVGFQPGAWR